jgi:hypothetical protein
MSFERSANAPPDLSFAALRLHIPLLLLAGCGGGFPLLHPVQTLGPGEVRASAGFSANVATAPLADALRDATKEAATSQGSVSSLGRDQTYLKGALVAASVGPGLAPFASARVGLGNHWEGGLAYTGRAVRADMRRSVDLSPQWAFSFGAAGSAVLYGRQAGDALPGFDLTQLHGWGADMPVMIGYSSDGDLYMVWLGARGGWEHVDVGPVRSVPNAAMLGAPPISLSATRFWGGGLVGVAAGFRHIHVAMELDVSYATIAGDSGDTHAQVAGVMLTPSSALWWQF